MTLTCSSSVAICACRRTLWAEAVNATGREILLENCNNGGYVPYGLAYGPHWHWDPERDPPMTDQGCPFNMFRVGSDIAPSPLSTVSNLLQAAEYLNVSKPGCWAYPGARHPPVSASLTFTLN